jgi:Flp pilus assembly protein TadB
MPKLYKILLSLIMLFVIVSIIAFSFTIILVGIAIASLFGVYRHYFAKTRTTKKFTTKSKGYTSVEVVDITK